MRAHHWWGFVVRGILAVIFGVIAAAMPATAVLSLVFVFGVYALVEGGFNIAAAFRNGSGEKTQRGLLVAEGIVSIIAGIIAFVLPGITALSLVVLLGVWALVTGVLEIAAAIRLRKAIKGEWLLALSGVLSIIFGLIVLAYPSAGMVAIALWIAAYAIVFGVVLIALGFKLRSRGEERGGPPIGGELAPSR